MKQRTVLWVLLLIGLLATTQVGCGKLLPQDELDNDTSMQDVAPNEPEMPSPPPERKIDNSIRIAMRKPNTFNPILNVDKTVDQTLKLVFDTLVDFNEHDEVIPNLAQSWSLSGDGTVLDIRLNTNIKWHDGEPLRPEDIVYSIETIQNALESPYKTCVKNIISSTVTDNQSLRIIYKQPFSGYAQALYFPIIPSHLTDIASKPVGTGAYTFKSYTPNREMTLVRNSNYFKGTPNIEEIRVLFTPDFESDLYSFDQGLIDVVCTDVIDWEKYAKNQKSKIHEFMTLNYDYIGINFNKPIFQDIKLRQALLYATNREYLLERYYLYHGQVVDVPVSPVSWLYEPSTKRYDLDINKAKTLLEGKTFDIQLLVNKNNQERKNVAVGLKKMYKEIGVNLEIIEVEEEVFVERVQNRQYDLFLGGWDLSIIPDLSFALHSSYATVGTNYGNYTNEKMDNLLVGASNAKSNEKLKEEYFKLQTHITEQLPYLSLYFRTAALITNEKIKGEINPHHMNIYQNIQEWAIIL